MIGQPVIRVTDRGVRDGGNEGERADADWSSPTVECQLESGDMLALYTDGVTESFNETVEESAKRG